jgi:hypothetical protein
MNIEDTEAYVNMMHGFKAVLLAFALAAGTRGCAAEVSPDKAYCEQVGQGARIIDVVINKPQISMEKGTPQGEGILVGEAIDPTFRIALSAESNFCVLLSVFYHLLTSRGEC